MVVTDMWCRGGRISNIFPYNLISTPIAATKPTIVNLPLILSGVGPSNAIKSENFVHICHIIIVIIHRKGSLKILPKSILYINNLLNTNSEKTNCNFLLLCLPLVSKYRLVVMVVLVLVMMMV
jgi:hypothetical protein